MKKRKTKQWRTKLHGGEIKVLCLHDAPPTDVVLDNPEAVSEWLQPQLENSVRYTPDVENMIVVLLNTRRRAISWTVISQGTIDTLLVHAREVFKTAIQLNAASILLVHNHPSGDPTPSDADIKVTRDMIRAGQLLQIDVLDHIVLGRSAFRSLRDLGYFYS
jgi:DNA repair protein RadC